MNKLNKSFVKDKAFAVRAEQEKFRQKQENMKLEYQCPEFFGLGIDRFGRR